MANGEQNTGYLRIAVSTAEEALPLPDARVTVTGEGGEEWVLFTDESGLTALLSLPAPPVSSSQSALSADPFATYRVVVEKEGFYRQVTERVPIFSGVTARQAITLIGLAEFIGEDFAPTESTDTVTEDPQVLHREGRR